MRGLDERSGQKGRHTGVRKVAAPSSWRAHRRAIGVVVTVVVPLIVPLSHGGGMTMDDPIIATPLLLYTRSSIHLLAPPVV